jgi:hypothetical protein
MSYFLGEKPLETKGKSNEEVKQAIESETAPGASELKPNPKATTENVNDAIAAIGNSVVFGPSKAEAHVQHYGRKKPTREKLPISRKGKPKKPASPPGLIKRAEKHKAKTHFPPGLVVSEKAKAKMEERQAKIAEKQKEKAAKKAEQDARWQGRPDVVTKWKKWEEKQQTVKDKILAKWDAQDNKRADKRAARLAKLADQPEKLEKEKKKIAEDDVKERLNRAKYMDYVEEKQLKALKKREHAQVRRDKVFNFFGGFLGWEKRTIPNIPASTLKDWALEGFEDLGEVDTKVSLVLLALVGYAIWASTKSKAAPVAAVAKKRRKKYKR